MNNVQSKKRANQKGLPFFVRDAFRVCFVIIFISTILLISTFSFDIVPPILNRGIQPVTFPKGLTIYGRWTKVVPEADADGGIICYVGK